MAEHGEAFQRRKRNSHTLRKYGISYDQEAALRSFQGGACPACGATELVVDHDHSSGEVRGMLCHRCNTALGYARDDPEILRALARYVEQPPANRLCSFGYAEDHGD